jgi:hypothetical protein
MLNNSYRIIKFKSGEEIITTIRGQDKNQLTIERPMVFKTTTMQNPYGQMKYVTVLQNWLSNSNQITTKIPKEFIMTFLNPSEDAINLYEMEKENEDRHHVNNDESFNIEDFIKDNFGDDIPEHIMENAMGNLMDDIMNLDYENNLNDLEEILKFDDDGGDDVTENIISMTIFFPPKALMVLVESGLLDIDEVKKMINTINHRSEKRKPKNKLKKKKRRRPPKTNPNHPNFGNNWFDWSEDLEDYF